MKHNISCDLIRKQVSAISNGEICSVMTKALDEIDASFNEDNSTKAIVGLNGLVDLTYVLAPKFIDDEVQADILLEVWEMFEKEHLVGLSWQGLRRHKCKGFDCECVQDNDHNCLRRFTGTSCACKNTKPTGNPL